jgi:hypothetical protein
MLVESGYRKVKRGVAAGQAIPGFGRHVRFDSKANRGSESLLTRFRPSLAINAMDLLDAHRRLGRISETLFNCQCQSGGRVLLQWKRDDVNA